MRKYYSLVAELDGMCCFDVCCTRTIRVRSVTKLAYVKHQVPCTVYCVSSIMEDMASALGYAHMCVETHTQTSTQLCIPAYIRCALGMVCQIHLCIMMLNVAICVFILYDYVATQQGTPLYCLLQLIVSTATFHKFNSQPALADTSWIIESLNACEHLNRELTPCEDS